jgi:cytosine/adenosine deaminase-related metal-dependent hydrolase
VLAGHTEERGPDNKDNFWTWRSRMYALSGKIDANALEAIARQVYGEMVATGYTSVAEFHYLHNEPDQSETSEAMFEAIVAAAEASGIRLTYVPVLYERAGFDQPDPTADQQRFASSLDDFLAHYERVKDLAGGRFAVGIGAHSLRAVAADSLAKIAALAAADGAPLHVHIAEQQREVDQCMHAHACTLMARDPWNGCSTSMTSTNSGAWCTRPTLTTRRLLPLPIPARWSAFARVRRRISATDCFRCSAFCNVTDASQSVRTVTSQ